MATKTADFTFAFPDHRAAAAAVEDHGFVLVHHCLTNQRVAALAQAARDAVERFGAHITRSSGLGVLDYHVVTGDVICSEASALFDLYKSPCTLAWVRAVT